MQSLRSIDDEQPSTVEEHFELIMSDNTFIDSEHTKISRKDLPEWFDQQLFKKGQAYYKRNILGMNTAYLSGLIAVFLIPTIAKILISTKQSTTPCAAFKRYFQTLLHIFNLHTQDIMEPKSRFYKSLNTIRWKHSMNSCRLISKKEEGITQKDMVLTQFGFIGYVLTQAEVISLTNEIEERQGINHFWRVIGHLLGISDRLNLCRRNEYETTLLCKKLAHEVYSKELKIANSEFMLLTSASIEGMQCIDPLVDLDAFLSFFYNINGLKYEKSISIWSKLNLLYRKLVFYIIGTPFIGHFVREFWNIYLRTSYWFYEICPIFAWIRYGKEESKIKLYPHSTF